MMAVLIGEASAIQPMSAMDREPTVASGWKADARPRDSGNRELPVGARDRRAHTIPATEFSDFQYGRIVIVEDQRAGQLDFQVSEVPFDFVFRHGSHSAGNTSDPTW